MMPRQMDGLAALGGGFVDSAPVIGLSAVRHSSAPRHTLVLLTRHYPKLPRWFKWRGSDYWQPSQKVPVSTWDGTAKTTIQATYDLGLQDAWAQRAVLGDHTRRSGG